MKSFIDWCIDNYLEIFVPNKEQLKSIEITSVSSYDEFDDSEDFSKIFIPINPSYYYVCLGNPTEVEFKFKNKTIVNSIIAESDTPFSKKDIIEILIDSFNKTRKEANLIPLHSMRVLFHQGEFVKVL